MNISPRLRRNDAQAMQHYRFRAQLFEVANRTPTTPGRLLHSFDELLQFARAVRTFDQCFAVRQLMEALPRYAKCFEHQYPGLFGQSGMLRLENPALSLLIYIRNAIERGDDLDIPDEAPVIPSGVDQLNDEASSTTL